MTVAEDDDGDKEAEWEGVMCECFVWTVVCWRKDQATRVSLQFLRTGIVPEENDREGNKLTM